MSWQGKGKWQAENAGEVHDRIENFDLLSPDTQRRIQEHNRRAREAEMIRRTEAGQTLTNILEPAGEETK